MLTLEVILKRFLHLTEVYNIIIMNQFILDVYLAIDLMLFLVFI